MKDMSFSLSECYLVFQKNTTSLEATSDLFPFGQSWRNVADKVSIKTFKHLVFGITKEQGGSMGLQREAGRLKSNEQQQQSGCQWMEAY